MEDKGITRRTPPPGADCAACAAAQRKPAGGCGPSGGACGDARADAAAHSLSPSDSPCVALCSTLYDDVCRGCGRTVFEVAEWVFMDEDEKREVWTRIRAQGFPKQR